MNITVIGGGHGPLVLSGIEQFANVTYVLPSWDNGGHTGKAKKILGNNKVSGDLTKLLIHHLNTSFPNTHWNELLTQTRFEDAKSIQLQANILENELEKKGIDTSLLSGLEYFIEDYIDKRNQTDEYARHSGEALGNLLCSFWLHKYNNPTQITTELKEKWNLIMNFGFPFIQDSELVGNQIIEDELVPIYGEENIDNSDYVVTDIRAVPTIDGSLTITNEFKEALANSNLVILAPGSPENYLGLLNEDVIININRTQSAVILIAPIFRMSKDMSLEDIVKTIKDRGINNLEVWLPTIVSTISVLKRPEILSHYRAENKDFAMVYLRHYQEEIKEYFDELGEKGEDAVDVLFSNIYKYYTRIINMNRHLLDDVTFVFNQKIIYDYRLGFKHSNIQLLKQVQDKINK
jgi:2-phospho-L-lactate transferase/gluconeogenesis factor (CofD/UPF0052 family)